MDDDFEIFRAAHEGDFGPLMELLNTGAELTPESRALLIKILGGKLKRPRHRQQTLKTLDRWKAIAKRVQELEAMGVKQTAAVVEVAAEFKCTDRTIRKVLAWDRQRKSTESKLTNIGVDIDRIDDLLSKLIGLARNGNPRALEFLVGFPPQLIEIAERLWDLADRANRKYGLRKPWRKPTVLVLPFLEKSLALNFTRI